MWIFFVYKLYRNIQAYVENTEKQQDHITEPASYFDISINLSTTI